MTKQTTFELVDNYPDNGTESLIDTLPGHRIVKIIDNFVAGHGKSGTAIMLGDRHSKTRWVVFLSPAETETIVKENK